ncbi:MAG TPA: AMP-binding protein, partial [Rhodothermales bacterium]
AALKLRAVPVNVNYRYQEEELAYLLDNCDAEAVLFTAEFASRLGSVVSRLPRLKLVLEVGGGVRPGLPAAVPYAAAIAGAPLPRIAKHPDDIILLYTGGTTGAPKGVMHRTGTLSRQFRLQPAGDDTAPPATLDEIVEAAGRLHAAGEAPRFVIPCPLMHGVGWWSSMMSHTRGGAVITLPSPQFDADAVWEAVQAQKATHLCVVGDVFAKPLLKALDDAAAAGRPYDIASLREINSAGAMWSAPVKAGLLRHADLILIDAMGASEGGTARQVTKRGEAMETAKFRLNPAAKVFTDDGREVLPGSGEVGMLATSQNIPLGYYKDPEKTARTFRYVQGVRYSFPGDYATVEADGTIVLLGRGSTCINSGGEKIYPEEVEEAIKLHPAVTDCLVIGIPDARFGEIVAAVVSLEPGCSVTEDELRHAVQQKLARYKAPKAIAFVDEVQRAPNGKADYAWAKQVMIPAPPPIEISSPSSISDVAPSMQVTHGTPNSRQSDAP